MPRHQAAKRDVVEVLGCGRPDGVHTSLALELDWEPVEQESPDLALTVGGRLLVAPVAAA